MVSDRMQWWLEAKYGMFIHWGLYAIPARGEWVMNQEHIPQEEYAKLAGKFDAKEYDPDEWVRLAKEAGMRYMVLTTRHHDGFCLFDSQVSDFTAPKTAAKRDLVQAYVEACHRGGIRVGFYYSLLDWRYEAYWSGPQADPEGWKELVDYIHAQVRELCTNYGKIDILWYDGGGPWKAEDWRSAELNAMVRQLQPEILINNRSRLPEDFDTPEQRIHAAESDRPWESCMTLNDNWGYAATDRNWKTPRQILINLVRCVYEGGNYLLNVGPKADGTIPAESERILKQVGQWLDRNGGSVYGTTKSIFGWPSTGHTTLKGNTIYSHVFRWPGKEMTIAHIMNTVRSVHLLQTGESIKFVQKGDRIHLTGLPSRTPDDLDTVIVLEIEGEPRASDYYKDGWRATLESKTEAPVDGAAPSVEIPEATEPPAAAPAEE